MLSRLVSQRSHETVRGDVNRVDGHAVEEGDLGKRRTALHPDAQRCVRVARADRGQSMRGGEEGEEAREKPVG